ncbi:MAG TPA: hypothetical protein VEL76_09310 [Gemmataceae bacterium]|nr:hypothetical protein [Gemmataceae bacterium]
MRQTAIARTTDDILAPDAFRLVLLASVAFPEAAIRHRLVSELDACIDEHRPLHSEAWVRAFLCDWLGEAGPAFYLEPAAREVAVRLLRLAFTRTTPKLARRWLYMRCCEGDDEGVLAVSHRLKPLFLPRTGKPRRSRRDDIEFVAGAVSSRLRQFQEPEKLLRAVCRTDRDGFTVQVRGKLPWTAAADLHRASTLGKARLDADSFHLAQNFDTLSVQPRTPEAMIRFSAALAREERLVLLADEHGGRIIVPLREFDEEEVRLPAVVSYVGAETWLRGGPQLRMTVSEDDRLAIALWAYLPESWADNDLLERLLAVAIGESDLSAVARCLALR